MRLTPRREPDGEHQDLAGVEEQPGGGRVEGGDHCKVCGDGRGCVGGGGEGEERGEGLGRFEWLGKI